MQNIVSIDGTFFNVRIPEKGIKRKFTILDDESAGRIQSGGMHRSIIGTFYNYTVLFDTSSLSREEYDLLYDTLSAPVDSHIIIVPYGQGTLTYEAYVTEGEDVIEKIKQVGTDNEIDWTGLSVQFIAMEPQRS